MIQINLFRISSDSKYIDIIIECPTGYHFNSMYIKRYDGEDIYEGWKNCSTLLSGTTTKETLRIATSAFGASTLFYGQFGVISDEIGGEEIPIAYAICSDINKIYTNLINSILKLKSCTKLDDTLYFKYMTLYAHSEAMRLNRYEDAERLYKTLNDLFSICGSSARSNVINSCNC